MRRENRALGWLSLSLLAIVWVGIMSQPVNSNPLPYENKPHVQCGQPRKLHLVRYEDGSARVQCGTRVLAVVNVPW